MTSLPVGGTLRRWIPCPVVDERGGLLGGERFTAALARWAAEARTEDAARLRTHQHWARRAAGEDASLSGVLLDLAERHAEVVVRTRSGGRYHGLPAAMGQDFVAVRTHSAGHVLVRLEAIVAVGATTGAGATSLGDRAVPSGLSLGGVLGGLAAERERVRVVAAGHTEVGELVAVGRDLLVLRGDDPARSSTYVPLAAVEEVQAWG